MKESISKRVIRNFSIMFGTQSVTWITGFVLLLFLPRYLGSEDFGRLYLALSIKMIFGLLVDFGGAHLIPKEVARSRETGNTILSSYLILRIMLWVLCLGMLMLISNLLGYSEHVKTLILILAVCMLWEGGYKAYSAYFQGIERMEYASVGIIAEKIFVALFSVIALLTGANSTGMAIIITLGALLHLIFVMLYARKYTRPKLKFDVKVFGLLRVGMPYFMFSLFSVIYYRVDAVMLSVLSTEEVTGWYGGAFRFFDMVMMLPLIYKVVIFPVFSKLWQNTDGLLQNTIAKSLKLILIIGVPVSILVFAFAGNIIHFFMGLDEFRGSVIILQIFALSIPIIYVDLILGSAILGAANKQKAWALVGFAAIILNVGANYFLIPYTQNAYLNGGMGAALATFITELLMLCSAVYLLKDSFLSQFKLSYIIKPALAGVIMIALIWLAASAGIHWMLIIVITGAAYIVCLYMLQLFDDEELKLAKEVMSREGLRIILNTKNS